MRLPALVRIRNIFLLLCATALVSACGDRTTGDTTAADTARTDTTAADATAADTTAGKLTGEAAADAVEGLWAYDTLSSPGEELRELTGFLFFRDGLFSQQSIFDGEPFETQMAMAHAGTVAPATGGVHLVAEQTVSVFPERDEPLSFRQDTEHDLAVTRPGDEMTLVFGSGTVQTFDRLGDGEGEVHPLEHGLLALVDGYLLLVNATAEGVTSGYGTFEKQGDVYDVSIVRWAETDGTDVSYRRDGQIQVTFDGERVMLPDGQSFDVAPSQRRQAR